MSTKKRSLKLNLMVVVSKILKLNKISTSIYDLVLLDVCHFHSFQSLFRLCNYGYRDVHAYILDLPSRNFIFRDYIFFPILGRPVCTIIDQRPFRFTSLCHLMKYLKDESLFHRVLQVQKGDCADASKLKV